MHRTQSSAAPTGALPELTSPAQPPPGASDNLRKARILAAVSAPEFSLPARQRQFKLGTTAFMLAIHSGAVAALLPRFWSPQGFLALLILYWASRSASASACIVVPPTGACGGATASGCSMRSPPFARFTGSLATCKRHPFYRWLDGWFLLLQLGISLYFDGQWAGIHGGGLGQVLWGIPLRLVLVYHVTWLVNSATHAFGYRNFDCPDRSRNCWWVALLTFGEGWHNNHHAHPASARHGLRWFEFDITWQHIRLLRRLGWARRVRVARYPA